jgi:hypothetical protein
MGQQYRQPSTCVSFGMQQQQRELVDQKDQVGLLLAFFASKERLVLLVRLALTFCLDKPSLL